MEQPLADGRDEMGGKRRRDATNDDGDTRLGWSRVVRVESSKESRALEGESGRGGSRILKLARVEGDLGVHVGLRTSDGVSYCEGGQRDETHEGESSLRCGKVGLESEGSLRVDLSTSNSGVLCVVLGEVRVHEREALLVDLQHLIVSTSPQEGNGLGLTSRFSWCWRL